MKYKLLVTSRSFGKLSDQPEKLLQEAGFEIINMGTDFQMERFETLLPEMDALIIGAHDLRPELLDSCKKLRIICKHGVGMDNVPVEKANACGITVTNAPGTNSQAVADVAFGLMLDVSRGITHSANLAKQGIHKQTVGLDVYGKTLGLLGFGRIGQAVAKRAQGFNMQVLAYDPYLEKAPAGLDVTVEEPVSPQNPLLQMDNVVVTDHIGMYSFEATSAVSMVCAEAVRDLFEGREPKNKVVYRP